MIQRFRAAFSYPHTQGTLDPLRYWQERILHLLIATAVVLGFVAYVPSVWLSIRENLYLVAVFDTAAYAIVLFLFLKKRLSYKIRAATIGILFYLIALVLLLVLGPSGAGPIWLFAFPVITGVLLGFRAGIVSLSINAATLIIVGICLYFGYLTWAYPVINPVAKWIVIFFNFMFLDTLATISLTAVLDGLQSALRQEEFLRISLQEKHREVEETNENLEEQIAEKELVVRELIEAGKRREELENQIRQTQKLESIGTLAGGIAHDFNNILASVLGYTELAMFEVEKGSQLGEYLTEVQRAGLRAKDLVQQILAFSRRSEPEKKPVQVRSIALEVVKMLRSAISTTIDIRHHIQSPSLVMADPTRLHQMLMNLCTNAAHAMEETGGILAVEVADKDIDAAFARRFPDLKPGKHMQIRVSDTGSGVDPAIVGSIFEPYFTTKDPGKGTGLGLSVVHGIVKEHGGEIIVESEPGKGSAFTVYIPILEKGIEREAQEMEEVSSGNERILLVDDEAAIAGMGRKILEQLGYRVAAKNDSREALDLFEKNPHGFDLVITDMNMPNMAGDRLAVELLKIRPDIPLILCTGYSKKLSREKAQEIGIKAVVMKPFGKSDLAKTVRKVLDQSLDNPLRSPDPSPRA